MLDRYNEFLSRELSKIILEKIGLVLLVDDRLDSDVVTFLEASINDCQRQLSQKFMETLSLECEALDPSLPSWM